MRGRIAITLRYGLIQTSTSILDQFDSHFIHISNQVRFIQITVKSVMVDGNVDIANITIFELVLVGNPVANNLIDRSAARFRELVIVQGRWICVSFYIQIEDG